MENVRSLSTFSLFEESHNIYFTLGIKSCEITNTKSQTNCPLSSSAIPLNIKNSVPYLLKIFLKILVVKHVLGAAK
jgi:hypothetical protein